jgi:hypothetical protein
MCIGGSSKIARTAEVVLRPLHAGLFGSGSAGLGLGLSALASLAGYNVSGVFAFLEELCNRVFRPGQAVH